MNDGNYDCVDFSDECNNTSDSIISGPVAFSAWVIGSLALFLNLVAIFKNIPSLWGTNSFVKLTNNCLIMLICLGDMLMGGYLFTIAIKNYFFGNYCQDKFTWLTSGWCACLGVISTTASQLSLFSMTGLSVFRLYSLRRRTQSRTATRNQIMAVVGALTSITLLSLLIGAVPLFNSLEDYFVNGINYPASMTLFIGAPTKSKHLRILEKYSSAFAHIKNWTPSWEKVKEMTQEMFSHEFNKTHGDNRTLHFYGNDGVCLFKYFVTKDDPQAAFSIALLLLNFTCFVTITVCYLSIHLLVKKSDRNRTQRSKRSKTVMVQTKVTLMVVTDFFCWVPFIVISLLHYTEMMDATSHYAFFSVIIIPINSVINPLLYDTTGILTYLMSVFNVCGWGGKSLTEGQSVLARGTTVGGVGDGRELSAMGSSVRQGGEASNRIGDITRAQD